MQFVKYSFVGIFNTLFGYSIFFLLVRLVGLIPEISNAVAYFVSLLFSFIFNKTYVFNLDINSPGYLKRFLVAFLFSLFANQLVLSFFYHVIGLDSEIAQIPAMVIYSLIFYILNKYYVFVSKRR